MPGVWSFLRVTPDQIQALRRRVGLWWVSLRWCCLQASPKSPLPTRCFQAPCSPSAVNSALLPQPPSNRLQHLTPRFPRGAWLVAILSVCMYVCTYDYTTVSTRTLTPPTTGPYVHHATAALAPCGDSSTAFCNLHCLRTSINCMQLQLVRQPGEWIQAGTGGSGV